MAMNKNISKIIGRYTALFVAIATMIFGISLIWEMINLSENAKTLGYVASIMIALGVVTMMASFYDVTQEQSKIFGLLALVFAIIYAPFCIVTYYLQLSIVASVPLHLSDDVIEAINFKPGSPTFAIDMLGYGFLCLSTLSAGFAFKKSKDKLLRTLCFIHGALVVPTVVGPLINEIYLSTSGETDFTGHIVLLFWCAIFIPIALLIMRHFNRIQTE